MFGFFALTLLDPECGFKLVFVRWVFGGVVMSESGGRLSVPAFLNSTADLCVVSRSSRSCFFFSGFFFSLPSCPALKVFQLSVVLLLCVLLIVLG